MLQLMVRIPFGGNVSFLTKKLQFPIALFDYYIYCNEYHIRNAKYSLVLSHTQTVWLLSILQVQLAKITFILDLTSHAKSSRE